MLLGASLIRASPPCTCLRAVQTSLGDPALEALDASTGVYELLSSRVERVAVGAHLDVDLLLGCPRGELVAAHASHVRLNIIWVDRSLHVQGILATRAPIGESVPATQLVGVCVGVETGGGVCVTCPASVGCRQCAVCSSARLSMCPLSLSQRNCTSAL